jgi:hypothetical protein
MVDERQANLERASSGDETKVAVPAVDAQTHVRPTSNTQLCALNGEKRMEPHDNKEKDEFGGVWRKTGSSEVVP